MQRDLAEMVDEDRRRIQVIHRQVEEALHLVLVEVEPEHPVRSRRRNHVGDQLGADGHPGLVLPVLPGVPEVRDNGRDPGGAGPLRRVHQEQQLHQVLCRRVGGLHDITRRGPGRSRRF
jgi:hypothetical protein